MSADPTHVALRALAGIAAFLVGCAAASSAGRPRVVAQQPLPEPSAAAGDLLCEPPTAQTTEAVRPTATTAPQAPDTARGAVEVVHGAERFFVLHGPAGKPSVMVYLHGRCGDPLGFRPWTEAARLHGTLVALLARQPCERASHGRWTLDVEQLDGRIRQVLDVVAELRDDPLDTAAVTLIGYSQGAARAEALAARFPERYPRLLLVSGPAAPSPATVEAAHAVALMAGERDRRRHLQRAAAELGELATPVRFFMLPGARHGEYGPAAERVLSEAFDWLFDAGVTSDAGDAPEAGR